MNTNTILIFLFIVLFSIALLLIPWKKILIFTKKEKYIKYVQLGISISIILFAFVLIFHFKTPQFIINLLPSLFSNNNDPLDWAGIWLNIFSLVFSSITAIVAINISLNQSEKSNFQFYSNFEFSAIPNSLVVTKIVDIKNKNEYNDIPVSLRQYDWYSFQFKVNGFLNPEIEYSLQNFSIRNQSISDNTKTFSRNKKNLFFEYYARDNCTEFDIILINCDNSNFEDHFMVLMNPRLYCSHNERRKIFVDLTFNLDISKEFSFIKEKTYKVCLTIENRQQNSNELHCPYEFKITKTKSKITNDKQ